MPKDRKALIRKIIEEAKPAEEYFAEQAHLQKTRHKTTDTEVNERDQLTTNQDPDFVDIEDDILITKKELKGISAVIAYVAHTQQISEQAIIAIFTTAFGIKEVEDLPLSEYEAAIHYLVENDFNITMN